MYLTGLNKLLLTVFFFFILFPSEALGLDCRFWAQHTSHLSEKKKSKRFEKVYIQKEKDEEHEAEEERVYHQMSLEIKNRFRCIAGPLVEEKGESKGFFSFNKPSVQFISTDLTCQYTPNGKPGIPFGTSLTIKKLNKSRARSVLSLYDAKGENTNNVSIELFCKKPKNQ